MCCRFCFLCASSGVRGNIGGALIAVSLQGMIENEEILSLEFIAAGKSFGSFCDA